MSGFSRHQCSTGCSWERSHRCGAVQIQSAGGQGRRQDEGILRMPGLLHVRLQAPAHVQQALQKHMFIVFWRVHGWLLSVGDVSLPRLRILQSLLQSFKTGVLRAF